jgi:hypothetical protein
MELLNTVGSVVVTYIVATYFSGQPTGVKSILSKTVTIILLLIFTCNLGQAQITKGFMKPIKPKTLKAAHGDISITPEGQWLLRPFVGMTANAIKIGGGNTAKQDLTCVAAGVTYTNVVNNYGKYGITAILMTNVEFGPTGSNTAKDWGGGLALNGFNGLINIGVSYIGKNWYALYGINIKELLNL